MSDELKPCPFCGGTAQHENDTGPNDEGYWTWIECTSCGGKANDAKTWNRRLPSDGNWRDISTAPTDKLVLVCRPGEPGVILAMKMRDGSWANKSDSQRQWPYLRGEQMPLLWAAYPMPPASPSPSAAPDAKRGRTEE
jgi:hypothetical protein